MHLSINVKLSIVVTALTSLASAVLSGSFFNVFLDNLPDGGSTLTVGFVSATSGLVMLALAWPVGRLTDRWSRAKLMRVSAFIGAGAAVAYFFAVLHENLVLTYVAVALYGAFYGVSMTPQAAIFADSLPAGDRTRVFVIQYAIGLFSSAGGPLIALALYARYGNEWDRSTNALLLQAGNGISLLSCIFLLFFDDSKTLGRASESLVLATAEADVAAAVAAAHSEVSKGSGSSIVPAADSTPSSNSFSASASGSTVSTELSMPLLTHAEPPAAKASVAVLDSSSLCEAAVAGAAAVSLRRPTAASLNGPLFEADAVGDIAATFQGSVSVDVAGGEKAVLFSKGKAAAEAGEAGAANASDAEEKALLEADELRSKRNLGHQTFTLGCGRCRWRLTVRSIPYLVFISDLTMAIGAGATVAFFPLYFKNEQGLSPFALAGVYAGSPVTIAILSMLALPLNRLMGRAGSSVFFDALGTAALFAMSFTGLPVWAAIFVYLLRTAAMNAGYPTQRAILMDVIPQKDRGFWSSLENLTTFTWTGSAALGGLLVDRISFEATFRITAIVYVLATLILALVMPLTAGEKVDDTPVKAESKADSQPDSQADSQAESKSDSESSSDILSKLSPKAQKGYGTPGNAAAEPCT